MTTTDTKDVQATVRQSIALAEAGCEIIRITAPNFAAARALKEIRKEFSIAGFQDVPLVADIHFLPKAAMEAIEHVDKVRVNPGNYSDSKKFNIREYTDQQYNEELERLYEDFTPLVLRAKELGRSLRIGTNHGSLSDRIMNRYGDTPHGMVESALEFIRIAESHGFKSIILSMKASNPKVMIEAYRLTVAKMLEENMHYPLHLGVTEAGEGEDARVKSAIGIGSLLYDGLGDTIRVSLTEDPVYEIPVARDLADKAMALWQGQGSSVGQGFDSINPYQYQKRESVELVSGSPSIVGGSNLPRVVIPVTLDSMLKPEAESNWKLFQREQKEARLEGALLQLKTNQIEDLNSVSVDWSKLFSFRILELQGGWSKDFGESLQANIPTMIVLNLSSADEVAELLPNFLLNNYWLGLDGKLLGTDLSQEIQEALKKIENRVVYYVCGSDSSCHVLGAYRKLSQKLKDLGILSPIWIRGHEKNHIAVKDYYSDRLLEVSMLAGPLLCDGVGDMISVETEPMIQKATHLAYAILQGARTRVTKTEFVACPSCGRTLFDLQSTTQKIKSRTGHLKGVTIAVMGCIVNGPGEMADADFGYVGGAPGKVNLYVAKECVQYHIPESEALDRLVNLIKEHGRWVEPT
jgi:(E)-4-hydroxy-3-methylbut-2-enyl-diphosphate synthase